MGRRKKKRHYSLEEYQEGDQRIGSLTDQGVSIRINQEEVRVSTNTSSDEQI